jgi:hypothetical protein
MVYPGHGKPFPVEEIKKSMVLTLVDRNNLTTPIRS